MSTIRVVYEKAPGFPATDQHPSAVRYPITVGTYTLADCVGGAPSQADLDAFFGTDAASLAKAARVATDTSELSDCKVDAQVLPLINQTKAEWIQWAGTNFPTLTNAERTRLGILFWVVSVGVRKSIRNGG